MCIHKLSIHMMCPEAHSLAIERVPQVRNCSSSIEQLHRWLGSRPISSLLYWYITALALSVTTQTWPCTLHFVCVRHIKMWSNGSVLIWRFEVLILVHSLFQNVLRDQYTPGDMSLHAADIECIYMLWWTACLGVASNWSFTLHTCWTRGPEKVTYCHHWWSLQQWLQSQHHHRDWQIIEWHWMSQ